MLSTTVMQSLPRTPRRRVCRTTENGIFMKVTPEKIHVSFCLFTAGAYKKLNSFLIPFMGESMARN